MSPRRFVAILGAAVAVIALALWLGRLRHPVAGTAGELLLPQLGRQLDSVGRVTIRRGAAQPGVTLHKVGERWLVQERADYPADTAKLRQLLLALAGARVIEEKTADPANYAALGVDDPVRPGTLGTKITIASATGSQALLLGKASMGGSFVRLGGSAQTLLVAPAIATDGEPRDWIEAGILVMKPADIHEARVRPPSGAAATLSGAAFTALAALTALDVAPAASVDFKSATVTTVTLADGSTLTLTGTAAGDKRWLTIASSRDAALNDRVRNVAFQVASSSFDAIFKP